MKKALVTRALIMAISLRKPPPGLIHHSDRGSQYTSHTYQAILRQHSMTASMSRKGNCWTTRQLSVSSAALSENGPGTSCNERGRRRLPMCRSMWRCTTTRSVSTRRWDRTPMNYEKDLNKVPGICRPLQAIILV